MAYESWNSLVHDAISKFSDPSLTDLASPSKSTAVARAYREAGNVLYIEKKFQEALLSYTMSIAYALEDSEELSIDYSNRSAAHLELAKYVFCLLDINRALNSYCPSLLRQKLCRRKERCLARMKSSSVGTSGGADDEIDEDATNPIIVDQEPAWRADVLSTFGNSLLPNASPKIELKYDEEWGRHFVATADIEPGEELICEDYFVTVLCSDDSRSRCCDFCLKLCSALIPCLSCVRTMYCSEECRTRAYDSYHRTECKLSSLVPCDSVIKAITMRMFLIGTEQGAALENLMNTLTPVSDIFVVNFDFADQPTVSNYLTALRLMTKRSFNETDVESRIKYAVKVVVALKELAFFDHLVPVDRSKEAESFAVALLINNYTEMHVNKFYSTGRQFANNLERSAECHGIILLHYLFNHSCHPNVVTFRRKRENITIAIRPIKKGEQLFRAYGDDFTKAPKAERTKNLDFTCQCEACSQNWPYYPESGLPDLTKRGYVLMKIIHDCILYNERGHDRVFLEVVDVVAPLLDDDTLINFRVDEIIPIIVKVISLLYKVMKPCSFSLMNLRYILLFFKELYYDEIERHPSQNEILKFPEGVYENDEVLTIFKCMMPTEVFYLPAITKLFDLIRRLNTYVEKVKLIEKKMVG